MRVCVVGQPQPDKESGLVSPTLHPCGECRKLMQYRERLSPDTLIYTITFTRDHTELFTLQKLIELHIKARDRGRVFFIKSTILAFIPYPIKTYTTGRIGQPDILTFSPVVEASLHYGASLITIFNIFE